jgi:putative flippase GtrA
MSGRNLLLMPNEFIMDIKKRLIAVQATFNVRSPELARITKFILVGLINTAVGYGAFFILSYFLYYLVALVVSHFIGVINSYIWNKYWTFKMRRQSAKEFIKFNLVYLLVLLANIAVLYIMVNDLMINPRIGQIVVLPKLPLSVTLDTNIGVLTIIS